MASAIEHNQDTLITPPPAREDESAWPYALIAGDRNIYADTVSELLNHVIDGYDQIPQDEAGDIDALFARIDTAVGIISTSQAVILAATVDSGEFDIENASEDVLTALLSPRGHALVTGADWDGVWKESVPLLLLTTDYAPFTEVPAPTGNVSYFDPSDELVFLQSLEALGLTELFVNAATEI